jgi:hypothetical protein
MYPYVHVALVSPSDTVNLPNECTAFIVGVSGNVKFTTIYNETVTIPCIAGYLYPIRALQIWATVAGAATSIVALS